MINAPSPPFHKSAFTGLLLLSALTLPVLGHERSEQAHDPCAATSKGVHSSAAAASSGHGSHAAASSCTGSNCRSSTDIATGGAGLSGSSTLPDGSSVTVHAGNGVVSSSTVTAGSSGRGHDGSASAATDRSRECAAMTGSRGERNAPLSEQYPETREKRP